jgi:hypothetical protein
VQEVAGNGRLGFDGSSVGLYDEAPSPAVPPAAFALRSDYFQDIGGISSDPAFAAGFEHIELSLRTWLCGGTVIRQPCSRVAMDLRGLGSGGTASSGSRPSRGAVTQAEADVAVASIADLWMGAEFKDLAFAARFRDRLPYAVRVSPEARLPAHVASARAIASINGYGLPAETAEEAGHGAAGATRCAPFSSFLREVYPGLAADAPGVKADFDRAHGERSGAGVSSAAIAPGSLDEVGGRAVVHVVVMPGSVFAVFTRDLYVGFCMHDRAYFHPMIGHRLCVFMHVCVYVLYICIYVCVRIGPA